MRCFLIYLIYIVTIRGAIGYQDPKDPAILIPIKDNGCNMLDLIHTEAKI